MVSAARSETQPIAVNASNYVLLVKWPQFSEDEAVDVYWRAAAERAWSHISNFNAPGMQVVALGSGELMFGFKPAHLVKHARCTVELAHPLLPPGVVPATAPPDTERTIH